MKQIFTTLSVYAVVYFVLLTVVLGLLYSYPQVELHMLMNMFISECIFQILLSVCRMACLFSSTDTTDLEKKRAYRVFCHERNKQRYSGTDSETLVPLTATSNGVRELSRLVTTSG